MVDFPAGAVDEQPGPRRRGNPRAARLVAALIVVAAVVVVVVQNAQKVTLKFLFITGHVRLIWVILVSLVIAGGFGYLLGRRGRIKRRRRRAAAD
jgi:uncharacterized integral membrane protein